MQKLLLKFWLLILVAIPGVQSAAIDPKIENILTALNKRFHVDPAFLQQLHGDCRGINGQKKSLLACKQALQQRTVPINISGTTKPVDVWTFIDGDALSAK